MRTEETSLRLVGILFRITKSPKHPVHPYGVMPIVVTVCGVVDSVVTSTHNWPYFPMDAVVNVCSPHRLNEQEKDVGHEMGWNKE